MNVLQEREFARDVAADPDDEDAGRRLQRTLAGGELVGLAQPGTLRLRQLAQPFREGTFDAKGEDLRLVHVNSSLAGRASDVSRVRRLRVRLTTNSSRRSINTFRRAEPRKGSG